MSDYELDDLIVDVIDIIDQWESEGRIQDQTISEGADYVDILPE